MLHAAELALSDGLRLAAEPPAEFARIVAEHRSGRSGEAAPA
jgi:hypothetical protein